MNLKGFTSYKVWYIITQSKYEINNKNDFRQSPKYLETKEHTSEHPMSEVSPKEIRKYFELNENEGKMYS